MEKGDIVILASDGLFDNLFDEDILDIVRHHVAAHTVQSAKVSGPRTVNIEPQTISDALAKRAKLVSEDSRNMNSPFQTRAIQEGLYYQVCVCSVDRPQTIECSYFVTCRVVRRTILVFWLLSSRIAKIHLIDGCNIYGL